jgi:hypothetical protein
VEDSERQGLQNFLDTLQWLLGDAVHSHPEWFPKELREPMAMAWREVEPLFARVAGDLDSRDYDQALEREGLVGNQLRFKLAGFQAAIREVGVPQRMQATPGGGDPGFSDEQTYVEEMFRRRPRGARLLGFFKVALDWANAIVESVGRAIPAAGAIGEFKKVVEAANRLNDEQRKPRWKRLLGL